MHNYSSQLTTSRPASSLSYTMLNPIANYWIEFILNPVCKL